MADQGDITQNAAFMDLYSRQIGAYGIETMSKLVNMKVLIVGLKGLGVEIAKNLILAGPGSVTLCDDASTAIQDLGSNFFLTEANIGHPRALSCVHKLQELNSLVRVSIHSGDLTEAFVSQQDVVIMTISDRAQILKWNEFCRNFQVSGFDNRGRTVSRAAPIRFIYAAADGVLGYMFSDFGPEFVVSDKNGEPPVQRVITNISCDKEGIVSLLDPMESELAKKADVGDNDHEGFISFSEVDGMYCKDENTMKTNGHSINSSGVWRAREIWKKVPDYLLIPKARGGDGTSKSIQYYVHVRDKNGEYKKDADKPDGLYWEALFPHECNDVPSQDFVRDADGNKMQRMTIVKEHYKVKIGDTTGYSKYLGGGIMQQVYQPSTLSHRSFAETLQQPIHTSETSLLAVDGEKEALGWWYPMLHLLRCSLLQFHATEGRFPAPGSETDADAVIALVQQYNSAMASIKAFCGEKAALCTIDLTLPPRAPPTKEGLSEEQLGSLSMLVDVGMAESRALLCLSSSDWDADAAMMKGFDDAAVAELEAPIKVHNVLAALRKLILSAGVEFQPVAVFIGGICAQEVVKHCGKFTPLNQVMYYDCIEVLPTDHISAADRATAGSRYDNNIAMFGNKFQHKLLNTKAFMIGCGALGCELLKNFAMLGLACGEDGLITVTDGDRIEVSNLNRQFLFRKQHVKMSKSLTASGAVKHMNPDINVEAFELLAMPETEKVFNDEFWLSTGRANVQDRPVHAAKPTDRGIDIAVNALDNVKARKYVDSRCVFYHKPLLESGTEGTKFNHQVIVPGVTVSYDEGEPDAPEGEAIPMCTLRNFPSTIIHCIEWARGLFEDIFVTPVADLRDYLANPAAYVANLREAAESYSMSANDIKTALDKLSDNEGFGLIRSMQNARATRDGGFSACVKSAFELFLMKFDHAMRDLQHQFPKDMMTDGKPFWCPPKRFPSVVNLDFNDEFVVSFFIAASNLFAVAYGLQPLPMNGIDEHGRDIDTFVALDSAWRQVSTVQSAMPPVPQWVPTKVKIESGAGPVEETKDDSNQSMQDMIDNLLAKLDQLSAIPTDGITAQPADFEKDLDLNFHIDFIAAASNLRASNYDISRATRHKTKMIAGKIIAAIATSTACATALVSIELLKLIQNKKLDEYRDSSNSFATNRFQMSTPTPAKVVKGRGEKKIQPDPLSQPQYFDETGKVIWEKVPTRQWVAYPDPHTKWDRLKISGSLTLSAAIEFMKVEHGLKIMSWLVTVIDENGKTTGKRIYSEPPVDPSIDEELLVRVAPLDQPEQKAKIAIMRCADMKNKQSYSERWKLMKNALGEEHKMKMSTSLRTLLENELSGSSPSGDASPLVGIREYALELDLEIASEPGVEAVTPPVILVL